MAGANGSRHWQTTKQINVLKKRNFRMRKLYTGRVGRKETSFASVAPTVRLSHISLSARLSVTASVLELSLQICVQNSRSATLGVGLLMWCGQIVIALIEEPIGPDMSASVLDPTFHDYFRDGPSVELH